MANTTPCDTNVALYRTLARNFPEGAVILFDHTLCHTLADGAGLAAVGLSKEQLEGKTIWEVFPREICEHLAPHYRRALSGQASVFEMPYAGRIYQVRVLPIQGEHGEIQTRMAVTQDITERKEAEAELRRSQQQYEQLVNTVDSIVWEGDARTFAFSFVSQQAERLLGYPCQRWISEPTFWRDHMHPDDRDWAVNYCALATAEKRSHEFEYRMIAADGRTVWLRDIVTVVVENGEPKQLRGVMVDVTERKLAEESLREKEEQYRAVFEATTDSLLIRNMDGVIVEVNPALCKMHGYTHKELIGQPIAKLIPPEHHHVMSDVVGAINNGGHFHTQAMGLRKDASLFHFEAHGGAFTYKGQPHILSVVRDITERIQAEEALREREAQYRSIFESSIDGLFINYLDGRLVDFNPAAARMHGYTEKEFRRLQPEQFIHANSLHLFQEYIETVKAGGEFRGRAVALRKDGSQFHVEIVGTQFTYRGLPHALAVVRDITEEVQAYQLLEQRVEERTHALYEQARTLASLEERQKLARELHDSVSQALYGIGLGAQTARAMLDNNPAELAEPVDYILSLTDTALTEMRALIFELRPESLETEGLAMALSKQAAVMRARNRLEVVTTLCDEPPASLAVKEALYRIAQEGLHNIIKHARASRVELRLDWTNGHLVLDIEDNGQGFDPGGSFPGHLGLRSMRERAEQLDGIFTLESAPGLGTRLHFKIPLHLARG